MKNLIILIIIQLTFISCLNTNNANNNLSLDNKVIITADSCKKWNLEPVNFEISYPDSYNAELNSQGGHYYLRLRKVKEDTLISELTFGEANGIEKEMLKHHVESLEPKVKDFFTNSGFKYSTDFLGYDKFQGLKIYQLRSTISFKNFASEGLIADGDFSVLMTYLYSKVIPKEAISISVMSHKKEPHNPKNNLGYENEKILNSIIMH
jgi:hypothetical protein